MSSIKSLGALIKKRRLEMRLTFQDLALMLDLKNPGGILLLYRIERGMNDINVPRICELLEITELDLKRCQKEEDRLIREYWASLPPKTSNKLLHFCFRIKKK